jgi:hypothetical protein
MDRHGQIKADPTRLSHGSPRPTEKLRRSASFGAGLGQPIQLAVKQAEAGLRVDAFRTVRGQGEALPSVSNAEEFKLLNFHNSKDINQNVANRLCLRVGRSPPRLSR